MPEYDGVTFSEAMNLLPNHIGIWLNVIMITAFLGVLFIKKREAQVILGAFVLSIPFTLWIYSNVGISSRLVGLGHVLFWLPAAIFGVVQIWRKQLYRHDGLYAKAFAVWLSIAATFYIVSNFWDVPDAMMFVANSCSADIQSASCNNMDLVDRLSRYSNR